MEGQKVKKILIHSIVFSPDAVSTAYLYNDIALGFMNRGFKVIVLTSTPHYNKVHDTLKLQPLKKYLLGLYHISDFHGIKVIHIPLKKYKSTILRIISFIYWHFLCLIIGLRIKNINYVLSPSPPLTIGLISLIIAKKNKAKFIYNIQEIYPDILIKNNILKSKILIYFLKKIELFIYKYACAVTTIDQSFYNKIIDRFEDKRKVKIIPNFVDIDLFKPITDKVCLPYPFINDINKSKLLYAGNIGLYQDWEPLIFAANELKNSNIEFWIIGDGSKKNYLQKIINDNNLSNIKLFPYQKRELMPLIYSSADIHFILINELMDQDGFPSKVYSIMATSKPLIVVTKENSPIYNFLNKLDCSILICKNKNIEFLNSILYLVKNKSMQKKFGENGLVYIKNNFSKTKIVNEDVTFISSI